MLRGLQRGGRIVGLGFVLVCIAWLGTCVPGFAGSLTEALQQQAPSSSSWLGKAHDNIRHEYLRRAPDSTLSSLIPSFPRLSAPRSRKCGRLMMMRRLPAAAEQAGGIEWLGCSAR